MRHWKQSGLWLAVAGAAVLCLHALLVSVFPHQATPISYGFFTLTELAALAACLGRANQPGARMRTHWLLVSGGLLVWLVADLIEAATELITHATPTTATIEDFFYFFYGVPLLLAIALPEEGEATPAFLALDGLQAAAAGYLTYVALFGGLPFSSIPRQAMPVNHLILIYDLQDGVLAILATARLALRSGSAADRRFTSVLTGYLWIYAVAIGIYNRIAGITNITGRPDVLCDIPFVALAIGAILVPAWAAQPGRAGERATPRSAFSLMLENSRSILLGLLLVALSAIVAQQHLYVALGFIFGAFVIYGIRSALLQSRIQETRLELEKARDRLEEIALQDGLTGIANRRCFDQRLEQEWARAHRSGHSLSLLLIDVDNFKELNDTRGHVAGDECLQQMAATLRDTLHRPGDLLARYGGDEFVGLLPETDAAGALRVASLMRAALAAEAWNRNETRYGSAGTPLITISIGCSSWEAEPGLTPAELVEAADKALYHAKENGRDRVEFAPMRLAGQKVSS